MRIAIVTLLLTSCTLVTELDGERCQTDLDCGEGRACSANNLCLLTSKARECVRTDQCGEGELCASGTCQAEEAARWACVGEVPDLPVSDSDTVTLRMKLTMRPGGKAAPLAGAVTAVACVLPTCDEMEGPFAPDEAGVIEVVVDQGFEGFVKLTGNGWMDTFYQLQAPLTADSPAVSEVTMLSASEVAEIAEAADAEVNLDERGVVLFQLLDCQGDLSEGVSVTDVSKNPEVDVVYITADQTADSAASATGRAGTAMVFDASIGAPKFKLARQSARLDLGSLAVTTVAGAITYVPYQIGR